MMTFDQAFEVLCSLNPDVVDPDKSAPVTASIEAIIDEAMPNAAFRAWVILYVQKYVEDGQYTPAALCNLVHGAFCNGVFIGIRMERPE